MGKDGAVFFDGGDYVLAYLATNVLGFFFCFGCLVFVRGRLTSSGVFMGSVAIFSGPWCGLFAFSVCKVGST